MSERELAGQTALVTGAGQGLGRAIAGRLAEMGAEVWVGDFNEQTGVAAVEEFIAAGGRARYVQVDVGDESAVGRLFGQIKETSGRLDILVNNAGTTRAEDIFATSLESWEKILRVNLTGTFLCSRAALPLMRERRAGRIVNITSIVAHRGALHGHVHYAATKGGLISLTKTLALTAAPFGVTVNAVAPGIIETELLFQTHGEAEVKRLSGTVPLGLGKPRDVALAVGYLCGEGGRYITGSTLDVNGGMYMR